MAGRWRSTRRGGSATAMLSGAGAVAILADIQVKYARLVTPRTLAESAALARQKGADAVVVTGGETGEAPLLDDIRGAKTGAADTPVLLGSGVDSANARELLAAADGAIVGTSLKTGDSVDPDKVKELVDARRLCG